MNLDELLSSHEYGNELYINIIESLNKIDTNDLIKYNFLNFLKNIPFITEDVLFIINKLLESPQRYNVFDSCILDYIRWGSLAFYPTNSQLILFNIIRNISNDDCFKLITCKILRGDLFLLLKSTEFHKLLFEVDFPQSDKLSNLINDLIRNNDVNEVIYGIITKYIQSFLDIFDFNILQILSNTIDIFKILVLIDEQYNNKSVLHFYIDLVSIKEPEYNLVLPLFANNYAWEINYPLLSAFFDRIMESNIGEFDKTIEILSSIRNLSPEYLLPLLNDVPVIINQLFNEKEFMNYIDEIILNNLTTEDISHLLNEVDLGEYDIDENKGRVIIAQILGRD